MPYNTREKKNAYLRLYKKNNPDKVNSYYRNYFNNPEAKEKRRWYGIKRKYGITKQDWENIYNEQEGKCFICERTEAQIKKSKSKYLVVDHCHNTGKIRGLLCRNCNSILSSYLRDDPQVATRIYIYLTREINYGIVPEDGKKFRTGGNKKKCHTQINILHLGEEER